MIASDESANLYERPLVLRYFTIFMTDRNFTARIENGLGAIHWLDRNTHERSQSLKKLVDKLANHALFWIRIYAPTGETLYLQHHIDRGTVRWHPGGYGGGGQWEVEVGVKRGTSEHPLYVHNGTGIYVGHDMIRPRHDRASVNVVETRKPRLQGDASIVKSRRDVQPVLTFQKRGEPRRFRAAVAGQRPQPFVYLAYLQARVYAQAHIGSVVRGAL